MEKKRVGQLATNYIAPNFEEFFKDIDPFPKKPDRIEFRKSIKEGDLTGKLRS
jgi:hypothetical protein